MSIAEVIRKPTILKAIEYGQECAGLEEKQVYGPLGWNKETWSRIFHPNPKNPANFDVRRLVPFMQLTRNTAPLVWLEHAMNLDPTTIRPYQTTLEREVYELREELKRKDAQLEVAAQLFAGRIPK